MHDNDWPPRLVRDVPLGGPPRGVRGAGLIEAIQEAIRPFPAIYAVTLDHFENDQQFSTFELRSQGFGMGEDTIVYYLADAQNRPLQIRERERYTHVRLVMRGRHTDDAEMLGPWRELKDIAERIQTAARLVASGE